MKEKTLRMAAMALEYILDTVAPPDPDVRNIEKMPPDAFISEAMRGEKFPDIPDVSHFLPYRGRKAKKAILELKKNENRKIVKLVAALMYDFLLLEISEKRYFSEFSSPLLLPIPVTGKVRRKRGWNQCELIADAMRRCDKGRVFEIRKDILVKVRESGDQIGMGRAARFRNLEGRFAVADRDAVRDRNVIVFDDVVTTGATLYEARRVLLEAGARKVILAALAH